MLVADACSAPVGSSATIQTVSADETDVEVVLSVSGSGAMRALVLFCNAVGVKWSVCQIRKEAYSETKFRSTSPATFHHHHNIYLKRITQ